MTLVIGVGQAAAGDDGVGLAVIDELERRGVPAGVELRRLADPSDLLSMLEGRQAVIIVDAVVSAPAGRVLELTLEALSALAPAPVSSHGLGVAQALELARALAAGSEFPRVRVIAVAIALPEGRCEGLSAEVARAVREAAERVRRMVRA